MEHTGGTRRLSGLGGRVGTTMRRMRKTDERNESRARVRVRMRGNIVGYVERSVSSVEGVNGRRREQ